MHKCKRNENKQTYIKENLGMLTEQARVKADALRAPSPRALPCAWLPINEIYNNSSSIRTSARLKCKSALVCDTL